MRILLWCLFFALLSLLSRCEDVEEDILDDGSGDDDEEVEFDDSGEYTIAKRVIGGRRSSKNQFPYAISLKGEFPQTKKVTFCGASIIAPRWILTAAHCFKGETKNGDNMTNPRYWVVQGGINVIDVHYHSPEALQTASSPADEEPLDTLSPDGKSSGLFEIMGNFVKSMRRYVSGDYSRTHYGRSYGVHLKRVFRHPLYVDGTLEYDIALAKLDMALPLGSYPLMLKAKLPSSRVAISRRPAPGARCYLAGWGCTKAGGHPSATSRFARLDVMTNSKCSEVYLHRAGLNEEHEFCAGYFNRSIGICAGDSGSGLICPYGDRWEVVGVASATHFKDPGNFPGVFTRVAYFNTWITETMEANQRRRRRYRSRF